MSKLVILILLGLSYSGRCNFITVGQTTNSANVIPFARLPIATTDCTRYQQAYSASSFTNFDAVQISGVTFLGGNRGNFAPGTYSLSFSTISAGIDTLSNTAFDQNLGADNSFFTSVYLSGSSPTNLTFTGTPFLYNPQAGNLLLNINIQQDGPQPAGRIASYMVNNNASGVFSRYQNFASGTLGIGLVTAFNFSPVPEPTSFALFLTGASLLQACVRKRRR